MRHAFIAGGLRTPIGNIGGSLSEVRADDLAAHVIRELLRRHPSVDAAGITDVILGCANQAGEDNRNVARMAGLLAGLPFTVPGETVNRLCASGMSAIANAARGVAVGDGDLYVAGGVESMTRAPYALSKASKPFARDVELFDTSLGWRFVNPRMKELYGIDNMGQTAENVAEQHGISRADQDAFALWSQQKAAAARDAGRLGDEIVPVAIPQKKGDPKQVTTDEFIRADSTAEALARLKPAFRFDGKGSVTAGNSSGLNDGAAALFVCSEGGARKHGLTPIARVVATAVAGVEPRTMGIGPVPASQKALARAGLTIEQMDVIELNEAFAAQALADGDALGWDWDRVNVNGGAIALGHPIGSSGARILTTLLYALQDRGLRTGLATLCLGGGNAVALSVERV